MASRQIKAEAEKKNQKSSVFFGKLRLENWLGNVYNNSNDNTPAAQWAATEKAVGIMRQCTDTIQDQ